MTTALIPTAASSIARIIHLITDAVTSPHTQRAYGRALRDFITWYQARGEQHLSKAAVQAYVSYLRANGTTAASINQRLTALRKFAQEAADNALSDEATAQAIKRVEGIRTEGKRLGNWLSKAQAQALIEAPNVKTTKDYATGPSWPSC